MNEVDKAFRDTLLLFISRSTAIVNDAESGMLGSDELIMRLKGLSLELDTAREFLETVARREAMGVK